jgi:probable F420-dependent oxidoreductase
MSMKIGVIYPQIEMKGDPEAVRRYGLAAEQLGYDHLIAYDHVLGAMHDGREPKLTGPYTENHPFHDPFTMFSYLAGLTTRLELVSGVIILPQRQTALVAKQAADLALFSNNRFRMGVGLGWNYVEYEALGQDFHTRGKRMEEQIALMRRLWSEPVVTYQGRFDRVDRASLTVFPTRPVPIWLGGFSEPAYRRAGRLADGFLFAGPVSAANEGWAVVRGALDEAGRDPAAFGREYMYGAPTGDADKIADAFKAWRDSGGTHASFSTMGRDLEGVDAHIALIEEVRRKVAG